MNTYPLRAKLLETICFGLLLLELLDLPRNPTAFCEVESGILCCPILLSFGAFVLRSQFKGAANLLDQAREIFRRLGGNSFDVSLCQSQMCEWCGLR